MAPSLIGKDVLAPSLIGKDVLLEGNIASKGEIQVEGEVKGDIQCSSLVVAESAQIDGGVTAQEVQVSGRLKGAIDCANLALRPSGHVDGEVRYESLSVEQGAVIEGNLRRVDKQDRTDSAGPPKKDDAQSDDYASDVKKYAANFNQAAVDDIVDYLGKGTLAQRDASLVSCSDPSELQRVRENFCRKKLSLDRSDDAIDAILKQVCEVMKSEPRKSRVTFYYLVAEKAGKLESLG
jgi:cytoskeletal protein CcmA (bactofilin family)